MSTKLLTEKLIEQSIANTWDEAKLEWGLVDVERAEEPDTCTCGHYPIIELCWIKNSENENILLVGNHCIKKFIHRSDKIFQCFARIKKNNNSSLNAETIEFSFEKNWINKWEYDFYMDVWRKRNLTQNQSSKKLQINQKIILNIERNKRK